jgi:hypothetical protein
MSDEKSLAVSPTAVWQLHEDVLRIFCETDELRDSIERYPLPELTQWLELHGPNLDEWHIQYPSAAAKIAHAADAVKHIRTLADLAREILRRHELFCWFARACVDWPSERDLPWQQASRHEEAFMAADDFISTMLKDGRIQAISRGQPLEASELESAIATLYPVIGSQVGAFAYAVEIPKNLRREAELAVKICEADMRPPTLTIGGEAVAQFIPSDLQTKILKALDGCALKMEPLAAKVCNGDSSKLYKKKRYKKKNVGNGPLLELMELGLVKKSSIGFYRPNALPPTAIPRSEKAGTKTHLNSN